MYVDAAGQFLRLVFHQNHANKYNIYNQVSRSPAPRTAAGPAPRGAAGPLSFQKGALKAPFTVGGHSVLGAGGSTKTLSLARPVRDPEPMAP